MSCTPKMTSFIQGEMQQRIKYGFSIFLLAEDAIILFEKKLKLSCITEVPHSYRRPGLILNLLSHSDSDTLIVYENTDRQAALESLHFGRVPPAYCSRSERHNRSRFGPGV